MPIATLKIEFDVVTGKVNLSSNGPPLEMKNFWYRVLFEAGIVIKDYQVGMISLHIPWKD